MNHNDESSELETSPPTSTRGTADESVRPSSCLLLENKDYRADGDVARILHTAVDEVEVVRSAADALDRDPQSFDLLLVNYDALSPRELRNVFETFDQKIRNNRLLVLGTEFKRETLATLLDEFRLQNLLAGDDIRDDELLTTVQKLLRSDIFGLDKYFQWGVESESMVVTTSREVDAVVEAAEEFVRSIGVSRRLVQNFSLVTEELTTNALYDAPVDEHGDFRYAHLDRGNDVELAEDEQIAIEFCSDGQRVGLSVCDPFGSLTADLTLDYLANCFRRDDGQINWETGGAGLGLYQSFEGLSHLAVNLDPEHRTEMIGLLNVEGSYRSFDHETKSLNVFVGH